MSDLYLVLRRRLDAVASWVVVGSETIGEAQKALGLSDERAARLVPVSVRTWIRWRERGQVPAHSVEKVAAILQLEIERPALPSIELPAERELRDHLDRRLDELDRKLETVLELMRAAAASRV